MPTKASLDSIELISHWMRISILIALLSSDYAISLNLMEMEPVKCLSTFEFYAVYKLNYSRPHCNSVHQSKSRSHSWAIASNHLGGTLSI
jgi:hypothetical protein